MKKGIEITLEELKGHYKVHFLTADQFICLIKEWHNGLVKELQLEVDKKWKK